MAGIVTPPSTVAQLSHAITIKTSGQTIGAINQWNPKMTRAVTELYELADGTTSGYSPGVGVPMEKVPGNISGMTIDVRRYDVYTMQMEQAFGTADLTMLSAQDTAFDAIETWKFPAQLGEFGGSPGPGYFNRYRGCWFSDLGRTIESTGDRIINVNATLQYTRKERGNL